VPKAPERTCAHLEQLTCERSDGSLAIQGATFSVRGGEIYGVAGVSGNGQAELAEVLMGIRFLPIDMLLLRRANCRSPIISPRRPVSGEIRVEQLQRDQWSKVAKDPADRIAIIPGRHSSYQDIRCVRTAAAGTPRTGNISKIASGRFGSNLLTTTHRNRPAKQKVSMSNEVLISNVLFACGVLVIQNSLSTLNQRRQLIGYVTLNHRGFANCGEFLGLVRRHQQTRLARRWKRCDEGHVGAIRGGAIKGCAWSDG
jgi:hypothetical protein